MNIDHKCFVRKLKFVKPKLISREVMRKRAAIIKERDVESAFTLTKLRLVSDLSREVYAERLSISVDDLTQYEEALTPIPVSVIDRACLLAGITKEEFISGCVDGLIDEAVSDPSSLVPESLSAAEVFDVLHAYALVKGRGDETDPQISGFLKMLVCGLPEIGVKRGTHNG